MKNESNWLSWYTPKVRVLCHIVFWLLMSILYYANYNRTGLNSTWIFVLKELLVTGSLFYCASWIIPRWIAKGKLYLIILFFVFAYIWWLGWTYILCYGIDVFFNESHENVNNYIRFVVDGGFLGLFKFEKSSALFMDFIFVVSIPLTTKFTKVFTDGYLKMVKLERDNLAMELDFLKSQVSPHFLFNILNSIYRMSEVNDPNAPRTVLQLSDLMRYVLYQARNGEILLSKELEFISNYVDLAKVRYGDKVPIKTSIPRVNDPYKIVPLLLIPFVENAFKHGPDRSRNGAWVEITLIVSNHKLVLTVKNGINNSSEKPQYGGVGLRNVKRRLDLHYPNRHKLEIVETNNSYTIELTIDFK
ncbi:hypothetical protein FXV77_05320 [Sphingobacterium phlebotomi]|uniref:Signal transduction histidine kinase internal region domain-containing protein n=1 Tax=Sphingobacterium phlebotomi TaxID=2605433 RepID=A0A5D4HD12_9SPHI|nr:histidine kinase [Sphingobacterium phlebotomi]TYR37425.1 hypothetical protein FXV77_05320 [Sphingobacterium phlebotomi]